MDLRRTRGIRKGEAMETQVMQIETILGSDTITLYWKRPNALSKDYHYQIYVNGTLVGNTVYTHYTVEQLQEETEYIIRIELHQDEIVTAEEIRVTTNRKKERLDVTKAPYFAVGDGNTLNTKSLQKAIEDCKENQVVYIPEGVFLTGALRLHSNMELYLEEGAVLQGTNQVKDYEPKIWSRFEGTELYCYSSLLNLGELNHEEGYGCNNVIIQGKGTIASGGKVLAQRVIELERERQQERIQSLGESIQEYENSDTIPGRVRPRLINISNCQNIVIAGLTLKNGASWNVHMIYSDQIVTHGCTFYSEEVWNGDGWDPDSSSNCTIFDCTFYTGDDSIAIKSGKNPEGNQINRSCEKIRIFHCSCAFGHGIAIGSEMSGGIRDIKIWDCELGQSLYGIEIKGTKKRGGYVKEVSVHNCTVSRILFHSVGYNDDGIGAKTPPVFSDCTFSKLHILGECFGHDGMWEHCDAIELCGFEEEGYELSDISFQDIVIGKEGERRKQNISLQLCREISFERIQCL